MGEARRYGRRWRLASIGFLLPSGAARAPDASWTLRSRLAKLSPPERSRLVPLRPDLVIELRSPTDTLTTLQSKMAEYIANGARLGWLIDPARRAVHIYRPGAAAVVLAEPESISGAPELPDFTLQLAEI